MSNSSYSIILPCYNAVEFMDECLNSIQSVDSMSNRDYEILCAVDGCQKTLNHFISISHKYPQLRIYYSNDNNGTYITNNFLISQTKYNNIIKFDIDDIMAKNLLTSIEKHKSALYVMLKGQAFKGKFTTPIKSRVSPYGGVWYAKKKIFEIVGGFKPWKCAADSDLMERLKRHGIQIEITNDSVFYRRVHNNSLTQHKDTNFASNLRKQYCKDLGRGPIYVKPTIGSYELIR